MDIYCLKIHSCFDELDSLFGQVQRIAQFFSEKETLVFCLKELVSNAIEHGNSFDPQKLVIVNLKMNSEYVMATVEDQGEGFNWNKETLKELDFTGELERGRGIAMVGTVSEKLYYNQPGNKATVLVKAEE